MRLNKENALIIKEGDVSVEMCYCSCLKCGAKAIVPKEVIDGFIDKVGDVIDCVTFGCDNTMTVYPAGKIKLSDWLNRDSLTMRVVETRDGFYINVLNYKETNAFNYKKGER